MIVDQVSSRQSRHSAASMQQELERLRAENAHLRELLSTTQLQEPAEGADNRAAPGALPDQPGQACSSRGPVIGWEAGGHDLSAEQISRYSRQLILPSFGVAGEACYTVSFLALHRTYFVPCTMPPLPPIACTHACMRSEPRPLTATAAHAWS